MSKLIDLNCYPIRPVLKALLKDKTTGRNIFFATDSYSEFGISEKDALTEALISGLSATVHIMPRVEKELEAQKQRTRLKAEVMTPGWICCQMNAQAAEDWFGRKNVFETLEGTTWTPTEGKIEIPDGKQWTEFVDMRCIEITCGEAPYLVSRYDVTTGELIPIERRIGLLDHKLRLVNENTDTDEDWLKWAERAFQSTYGYEWQGDNVLLARCNLVNTYVDYHEARFGALPDERRLKHMASIIVWNIWQMDGLTGTIPYGITAEQANCEVIVEGFEASDAWAEAFGIEPDPEPKEITPACLFRDWRCTGKSGRAIRYNDICRK